MQSDPIVAKSAPFKIKIFFIHLRLVPIWWFFIDYSTIVNINIKNFQRWNLKNKKDKFFEVYQKLWILDVAGFETTRI